MWEELCDTVLAKHFFQASVEVVGTLRQEKNSGVLSFLAACECMVDNIMLNYTDGGVEKLSRCWRTGSH